MPNARRAKPKSAKTTARAKQERQERQERQPRARAEAYANQAPESAAPQVLTSTAKEKLRHMVARIEKLEEEKAGVANDVKEAYAEAKGLGYDTKALRKVITLRKMDANERAEQESMIDLYRHALGDI